MNNKIEQQNLINTIKGTTNSFKQKSVYDKYKQKSTVSLRMNEIENDMVGYRKLMKEQTEASNNIKKKTLLIPIGFIGVFLSMFFQLSFLSTIFIILIFVGFISSGKAMVKNYKDIKAQDDAMKDIYYNKVIPEVLSVMDVNVKISKDAFSSGNKLISKSLVQQGNTTNTYVTFENEDENNYFRVSNAHIENVTTDSDGDTQRQKLFDGQVFQFKTNWNIEGTIRIIPKAHIFGIKRRKNSIKDFSKIEVMDDEINKKIAIYSNNTDAGHYIHHKLLETAYELQKEYTDFAICIEKNDVYLAVNTNYKLFDIPNTKNKVDCITAENIATEIEAVIAYATEMKNRIL